MFLKEDLIQSHDLKNTTDFFNTNLRLMKIYLNQISFIYLFIYYIIIYSHSFTQQFTTTSSSSSSSFWVKGDLFLGLFY